MRKRSSIAFLIFFSIFLSLFLQSVSAQDDTWNPAEVTSNPGFEATIDGVKDPSWEQDGNVTWYVLDGLQFKLFVQHYDNSLYFLIEARFTTGVSEETVSLYLASTNRTVDINDKKQITIYNASQSGNETSAYWDLYKGEDNDYLVDQEDSGFVGAAGIGESNFRIYEYQISLDPVGNSSTEDVNLDVYKNYAVQLGYNTSNSPTEKLSEVLLVQIGPKSSASTEGEIGEFNFNSELYIVIVLLIISVFVVSYGIMVFTVKQKVGLVLDIENDEEEEK